VIGNRSFSDNPKAIIELAKAFVDGQHQAGMTSVGKHFPGHGFIHEDSHEEISIDNRSLAEMENDIDCFESLVNHRLGAIMPGHVVYKKADNNPASLSSFWLKDFLRKKLNFKGIIISDDLSMKGVADYIPDISERVLQALTAGCDVVLICNKPEDVDKFLDRTGYDDFTAPDLSQLRIKKNQNFSIDGLHVEDVKNLMKNMNFIHTP
jgi:beta-N-acetylhexosaminidase